MMRANSLHFFIKSSNCGCWLEIDFLVPRYFAALLFGHWVIGRAFPRTSLIVMNDSGASRRLGFPVGSNSYAMVWYPHLGSSRD